MAEGYLRHVAGDRFEAMSAGLAPAEVHPLAVEAMAEIGINIAHQKAKDVTHLTGSRIPYLVTVCEEARMGCPVFRGIVRFLHWNLHDPCAAEGSHEQKLAVFRRVRDQIATKIREELLAPLAVRTIPRRVNGSAVPGSVSHRLRRRN
jgi:arsenate reductase